MDGNSGRHSIAFVIVEWEKYEIWTWFLQYLKEALEIDFENITIVSNQEKGLHEAWVQTFHILNIELITDTYGKTWTIQVSYLRGWYGVQ